MPEVTRRRLLSSAAAGAGGVLASSFLPPALARAAAEGPRRGSLNDVKHVVIHMQENRSFDHYFGTLAGVRGFGDPNVLIQHNSLPTNGKSVFYQYDPQDPNPPTDYLLPWHLDTHTTSAQAIPSTSHAWTVQHQAINITVGQPDHRRQRQLAPRPPRRRRPQPRAVHDELLRAPGHPVPLRAGRDVHAVRRLPLLAARTDVAQPHVPDDGDDRPRSAPAAARSPPTSCRARSPASPTRGRPTRSA